MLDFDGTGMSIMEHSHRGKAYDAVHRDATARLKALLGIGDDYQVLFLQGGASHQFVMLPFSFIKSGQSADYVVTGSWSKKALSEAKKVGAITGGSAKSAADMHVDGVCTRIPAEDELKLDANARFVHLTSNNTIFGTQWHAWPKTKAPLVVDVSSDFLWKPMNLDNIAMLYGGAQKNVGPSGLAIVVMKKSFLAEEREDLPNFMRYAIHAEQDSLYNTPNTWAIYLVRNVLAHIEEIGGLEVVEKQNRAKADLLYGALDADADFFRTNVAKDSRSTMNVVWSLPTTDLDAKLVKEATEAGFVGLKGHRSVGGLRASIYNACSLESVSALVDFLRAFRKRA